jgi:hypothetical protein
MSRSLANIVVRLVFSTKGPPPYSASPQSRSEVMETMAFSSELLRRTRYLVRGLLVNHAEVLFSAALTD